MIRKHSQNDSPRKRIVIIGGGFAGLSLARDLRKQPLEIVLIDKNNYLTFQPLLYQVATAGLEPEEITYPLRSIVQGQKNVRFRLGEVARVDWLNKNVVFSDGSYMNFDYLVLAAGAAPNYFGIEGAEEHSFPLKSLSDAIQLRSHVLQLFERADQDPSLIKRGILNFVIVGGGPTGVEMAGALIELIQHTFRRDYPHLPLDKSKVVLIEAGDSLISTFMKESRDHALEKLQDSGVHIALNDRVIKITEGAVYLNSQRKIPAATTIWAVGVKASPLAGVLGVEQTRGGRIVVDQHLRIPEKPDAFVIGDMAAAQNKEGDLLPQLASVAHQAGKHVAKQISNELKGIKSSPFAFKNPGQMATIGRHAAVAEFPGDIRVAGFFAWLTWLTLHLALLFGFHNRMHVLISWLCGYFTNCRNARLIMNEPKGVLKKSLPRRPKVPQPSFNAAAVHGRRHHSAPTPHASKDPLDRIQSILIKAEQLQRPSF